MKHRDPHNTFDCGIGQELPRWNLLQAALRKTTEALAHELAQPATRAPDWSELEWCIARAVAAIHGVSPLLARTSRWQGPPGWASFLQDQRAQTQRRHARIQTLLQLLDERARTRDLPAVALKGAELHARGLYAAGDRPMADVDLLVRPADSQRAAEVLESLGFRATWATDRERTFVQGTDDMPIALGEQSDNPLKVELHEHIREPLPLALLDVSDRIFPTQPHPGLNPYPTTSALMIHLLLHAAGTMPVRSLRLVQLHDLALLCTHMTDPDWDAVLGTNANQRPWWALPPLSLVARYYHRAVPTRVLSTLKTECPRILRTFASRWTLSDVSLSRLRTDAFPGLEWAQSLPEMLRYIAARIHPDAKLLASRDHQARTQAPLISSPWHHSSQGKRMVRWLLGRIPRALTMYAVRLALEQPGGRQPTVSAWHQQYPPDVDPDAIRIPGAR